MKIFEPIIVVFLIVIFVVVLFIENCRKPDCSGCAITEQEKSFIVYKGDEQVVYKNDSTGIFDTLKVYSYLERGGCSMPCETTSTYYWSDMSFTKSKYASDYLSDFVFAVEHNT